MSYELYFWKNRHLNSSKETMHKHFQVKKAMFTDEYCNDHYDFWLSDQIYRDENDGGKLKMYYQLHTRDYYHINDTMQFEIPCLKCNRTMKPFNLGSDGHTHSWYHCPHCNKEK